ncbi:high light inducible protein [Synechococcus sp. KORDI-52]|uniref:chlorophyll a/b-binding protein n=1 Tax=Synechococcus sp. KORDI-52 TaxID=585425 RepID=UPI0004E0A9B6|nr:chlorophyll a/b-binding protein [Synechococcus sp. KORDI-52]AII49267.1 high light inducible protein [Synechococcus sp. KORDI-52]
MSRPAFRYEEPERFGESLTTARPWNRSALSDVERLNGRVAMLGFTAAVVLERLTGLGIAAQLRAALRWYLQLG